MGSWLETHKESCARGGWRERIAIAALISGSLLAAGLVSGCGSDESEGDDPSSELAAQPEPEQPISEQLEPLNKAIAEADCDAFAALQFSLSRPTPEAGAPATPEECEFLQATFDALEGAEFDESAEFGTGAMTQAPAPSQQAGFDFVSMIWLLDYDGIYRHVTFVPGDEQIGTEPAADPMPAAEDFVEAARAGDCDAMEPTLNPDATLVQVAGGDLTAACERITEGQLLAPALKESPEAEPVELGGTLDTTFVGVPTKDDYFTIVLGTPVGTPGGEQPDEMLVVDVFSNTVDPDQAMTVVGESADPDLGPMLEDLNSAANEFIEGVSVDVPAGDLAAVQAGARSLRDAFYEFDLELRELALPVEQALVNAVLDATGAIVADLDEVGKAGSIEEASELVDKILGADMADVRAAMEELTGALSEG